MTGLVRCPKGHIVGECRDGAFVVQMRRRRVVYRAEKAEIEIVCEQCGDKIRLSMRNGVIEVTADDDT